MHGTGLRWGVLGLVAVGCVTVSEMVAQARPGGIRAGQADRPAATALREIDDPYLGTRWLLVKDAAHPGGPGRLVLVPRGAAETVEAATPIIHAGDRVLVEEHTAVVDSVLEAVALGPARAGGQFPARLKVGGRVLRVAAVAPGRAVIGLRTDGGR